MTKKEPIETLSNIPAEIDPYERSYYSGTYYIGIIPVDICIFV